METVKHVFLFSGKRKSGKDYISDRLQKRLGLDVCLILRLSGPLKEQYAKDHGLDYQELLNASFYKETHRAKMIKWGEDIREANPYFFCQKTVESAAPGVPVWIVSDARRLSDVIFFKEKYPNQLKLVRITASDDIRKKRGFIFTEGIDDAESECGLDKGLEWDITIDNSGDESLLDQNISTLVSLVQNSK
ncbi:phosphomevalonate kinase-like isoform X1 [Mya arenaria]|uniref:phosphomevalonate kinase-like isoform X1 n=1 Tax=Mya arenaria TaxID=6604 RepID=UPI0022E1F576|nr:phosphomevalonate kinase-like isoform X1 [Mya arenaria]